MQETVLNGLLWLAVLYGLLIVAVIVEKVIGTVVELYHTWGGAQGGPDPMSVKKWKERGIEWEPPPDPPPETPEGWGGWRWWEWTDEYIEELRIKAWRDDGYSGVGFRAPFYERGGYHRHGWVDGELVYLGCKGTHWNSKDWDPNGEPCGNCVKGCLTEGCENDYIVTYPNGLDPTGTNGYQFCEECDPGWENLPIINHTQVAMALLNMIETYTDSANPQTVTDLLGDAYELMHNTVWIGLEEG